MFRKISNSSEIHCDCFKRLVSEISDKHRKLQNFIKFLFDSINLSLLFKDYFISIWPRLVLCGTSRRANLQLLLHTFQQEFANCNCSMLDSKAAISAGLPQHVKVFECPLNSEYPLCPIISNDYYEKNRYFVCNLPNNKIST